MIDAVCRGKYLGDIGEQSPPKFKAEGMELPISYPKFQKYLTKYKFLVFPTVRTGSCVVCIVLKLQYYAGNCLLFCFCLYRH